MDIFACHSRRLIISVLSVFSCSIGLSASQPDYLMICHDSLYDAAEKLAQHRSADGYAVTRIKLSDIGSGTVNANQINAWIKKFIVTHPALKYIAIVGDHSFVPSFLIRDTISGVLYYHSDQRYGVRDTNALTDNYLPSVCVGRIPVSYPLQMTLYFDKVVKFETSFNRRNTVAIFGSDGGGLDVYGKRDLRHASALGYDTANLGTDTSTDKLFSALNNRDLAMVFYYGHGNWMQNSILTINNLDRWKNTDLPVLYFSGACEFNKWVTPTPSFGTQMLLVTPYNQTATGGAACSIGASVAGGYGYGYNFVVGVLDSIKRVTTIGEAYLAGLRMAYYTDKADANDIFQDTVCAYGSLTWGFVMRMSCMGDPALRIHPAGTANRLAGNARPNRSPIAGAVSMCVFDIRGKLVSGPVKTEGRAIDKFFSRRVTSCRLPAGAYVTAIRYADGAVCRRIMVR